MEQAKRKQLVVKSKAVGRTLKQYKAYKAQVDAFDINVVSQDKKKGEFYQESLSALDSVKKSLVEFVTQYENFLDENKDGVDTLQDPVTLAQLQKGRQFVQQARTLLPAQL